MVNTVKDIRTAFIDMYRDKDIQPDGNIEIIGASFLATEPTIFGKPNREYQEAEVRWYDTLSLNLRELKKEYGKIPVISPASGNTSISITTQKKAQPNPLLWYWFHVSIPFSS